MITIGWWEGFVYNSVCISICSSIGISIAELLPGMRISAVTNLVLVDGYRFIHKLIERTLIELALLLAFGGNGEKLDFRIQIIYAARWTIRRRVFHRLADL